MSITLTSPTSAVAGEQKTLSWTTGGGFSSTVDVRLSLDNGATFPITLASNLSTTSYNWRVSWSHRASEAVIKVVDHANASVYGLTSAFEVSGALVVSDLVHELTNTEGTGDYTLEGASAGERSFADSFSTDDLIPCAIRAGEEYEVGVYRWTGSVLVRDVIDHSSNSGSPVNWGAGPKDVICSVTERYIEWVQSSVAALSGATFTGDVAVPNLSVNSNAFFNGGSLYLGSDIRHARSAAKTETIDDGVGGPIAQDIIGSLILPNSNTDALKFKNASGTPQRVVFVDTANNHGFRNEGVGGGAYYGTSSPSNTAFDVYIQRAGNTVAQFGANGLTTFNGDIVVDGIRLDGDSVNGWLQVMNAAGNAYRDVIARTVLLSSSLGNLGNYVPSAYVANLFANATTFTGNVNLTNTSALKFGTANGNFNFQEYGGNMTCQTNAGAWGNFVAGGVTANGPIIGTQYAQIGNGVAGAAIYLGQGAGVYAYHYRSIPTWFFGDNTLGSYTRVLSNHSIGVTSQWGSLPTSHDVTTLIGAGSGVNSLYAMTWWSSSVTSGTVIAALGPSGVGNEIKLDDGAGGPAHLKIFGNLSVAGKFTPGPSTFGTLPSASANVGAMYRVTDRTNRYVKSNGTNWVWCDDESTTAS